MDLGSSRSPGEEILHGWTVAAGAMGLQGVGFVQDHLRFTGEHYALIKHKYEEAVAAYQESSKQKELPRCQRAFAFRKAKALKNEVTRLKACREKKQKYGSLLKKRYRSLVRLLEEGKDPTSVLGTVEKKTDASGQLLLLYRRFTDDSSENGCEEQDTQAAALVSQKGGANSETSIATCNEHVDSRMQQSQIKGAAKDRMCRGGPDENAEQERRLVPVVCDLKRQLLSVGAGRGTAGNCHLEPDYVPCMQNGMRRLSFCKKHLKEAKLQRTSLPGFLCSTFLNGTTVKKCTACRTFFDPEHFVFPNSTKLVCKHCVEHGNCVLERQQ